MRRTSGIYAAGRRDFHMARPDELGLTWNAEDFGV